MKTTETDNRIQSALARVVAGTALFLLLPMIAMQFIAGINWDVADFVLAGLLLLGAGLSYALLTYRLNSAKYRIAIGVCLAVLLLLIWAELAVGLFD